MKKYILITGATSGIGAVCAKRLSSSHSLILAGRNVEKLGDIRKTCSNSEDHVIWCCDFLTERDNIFDSLLSLLEKNDACIESYIHFAGLTQILPIKNFSIQYVDKIFNVNFFSIIEIIRLLAKKTYVANLKSIVLTSALFSKRGDIGNSIYAASKGAINSLVISLAQELAPVRINAILPGAVMTSMAENCSPAHTERLKNDTPLGLGTPDNIVDYVEFLISDKASWVTGQNIFIDGGRSTR